MLLRFPRAGCTSGGGEQLQIFGVCSFLVAWTDRHAARDQSQRASRLDEIGRHQKAAAPPSAPKRIELAPDACWDPKPPSACDDQIASDEPIQRTVKLRGGRDFALHPVAQPDDLAQCPRGRASPP